MSALPKSALRPSNLPKLAVCPCYESNPVAGPAAERGTLLDNAFRAELLGLEERFVIAKKLTADEIAAVGWSVSMVRAMSGRERVLTREDDCRVAILNLTGTADAIVPTKLTHFDLKTGARRNYKEQMAAYALGLMSVWWKRMQSNRFLDNATSEQREALKRDLEPVVTIYNQL